MFRGHGFSVDRVPNSGGLWLPGDLSGLEGYHLEAKRQETLHLPAWIAQSEADCPEGWVPTVSFRRNHGSVPDRWWSTLPTTDFMDLLRAAGVDPDVPCE